MMSSKEINFLSIFRKQYIYKLKAYSTMVYWLIITQLIALLLFSGATSSIQSSNEELSVSLRSCSSNIVLIFSFIWIMIITSKLTTKQYNSIEIPLVTNRFSGNLSNIAFLTTACIFGGLTSSLCGILLRVIMYFTIDRSQIVLDGFFLDCSDLLLGITVAILYMILISALSYLTGILVQLNGAFVIIIPVVIIGLLRIYTDFCASVFKYFAFEVSLPLFALKVISMAIIIFGASLFLSNR
ncbi:MAG TPA: hypothetical protein VN370_10345, partial [Desulfitobacteriaceae bacterium]|nr:hypothetical protein [Desulfitobacteriaceae bacterium]